MKKVLLRICIVVLALLFTSFTLWRLHLARVVNGQLQAIRAAGLPVNGAELNAYYPAVPDDQNAALVMEQSFALLQNYPDSRSNEINHFKIPAHGQVLTDEQKQLLAGYVAMNSNALAKADEAIKLPRGRYPIDLSLGVETLLPHLQPLKTLTLIQEFRALLDTNNSAEAVLSILGMAHTLDSEPVLISKLVRMAMVNISVATLECRLNAGGLNDSELTRLDGLFAAAPGTNQIINGFIGERGMYIKYFRMSWNEIKKLSQSDNDDSSGQNELPSSDAQPLFLKFSGIFERDLRFYLQSMQTNISLAGNDPLNIALITNVQNQILLTEGNNYYILSSMFLPALGSAIFKEVTELALIRSSQTALAVEHFRLAHSRLPENLNELVPQFLPAVPADPFDGQPLRYHRLEKGYVVYSIGRDGHDNGGRERPANAKSSDQTEYDLTFTVER